MTLYGHPLLMRAGLGNMLFPWARCFLWCREREASMLAPRWMKLRLGPYLRAEKDKRRYERLFRSTGYVRGPAKALALATHRRVEEATLGDEPRGTPRGVVVFSGLGDYFSPLVGHQDPILAELTRIVRTRFQPELVDEAFVAVHVRLGDFTEALRQPLDWYVEAVRRLRSEFSGFPVRLYSDGRPDELAPILRLPDVSFVDDRAAITDMLEIAQSSVVVASSSTFSMWGSFLGDVPSLWFPGRLWQRTAGEDMQLEWGEDDPIHEPFLARVAAKRADS